MKRNRFVVLFVAVVFAIVAAPAIAAKSGGDSGQEKADTIEADKLYLYNWAQYMDPAILKKFEEKYDVEVVRSFFSSNPELFAKMQAGGVSQYDVIFPSSYYIPRLVDTGLIQPLNLDWIPNYDNLLPKFQNPPYDPGGKDKVYSVAYQWGTTGILYNEKIFSDPPHTWALLFDPDINSKYPFSMITDPLVMMGAACVYLGYKYTCTKTASKKVLKQATQLLIKTKNRPNFSGFVDGTPAVRQVARGNLKVAVTWNGDFWWEKVRHPDMYEHIKYFLPKGGTEIWADTMAIPSKAPHPKLAHKFINFILKPKIGAQLSNWNSYPSPNEASQPYINERISKPPVTPSRAAIKNVLHFSPVVKGKRLKLINQLWSLVLAE